jgi:hypothetical protein
MSSPTLAATRSRTLLPPLPPSPSVRRRLVRKNRDVVSTCVRSKDLVTETNHDSGVDNRVLIEGGWMDYR